VCQDAVRAEHDLGGLWIRGEHCDDHVRVGYCRRDAVRPWPPTRRRSTAGRLRLYPMTVCPAWTRLAAMGEPMTPRPMKAMVRAWTADVAMWSALLLLEVRRTGDVGTARMIHPVRVHWLHR
jgi:hypothetical protein